METIGILLVGILFVILLGLIFVVIRLNSIINELDKLDDIDFNLSKISEQLKEMNK